MNILMMTKMEGMYSMWVDYDSSLETNLHGSCTVGKEGRIDHLSVDGL